MLHVHENHLLEWSVELPLPFLPPLLPPGHSNGARVHDAAAYAAAPRGEFFQEGLLWNVIGIGGQK